MHDRPERVDYTKLSSKENIQSRIPLMTEWVTENSLTEIVNMVIFNMLELREMACLDLISPLVITGIVIITPEGEGL